ncbi:VCBS repeat-containing protein [Tessaracoccus sp. SD287]|uniref:FG-GAP repeat domain-containing protein n=1 Tax=Tessaracoccus sp. SD287 TaxID=2782008 RepID=UPI001A9565E5|nr:VCBS repeat-containing protein [Tessaracoccus sp. SD287]MBO1031428.1 VCBS repeat-containing protein [Tessaracoccus sp. SD287]
MKKFLRTLTIAAVAAAASVVPVLTSAPVASAAYSGALGDLDGDGKADVVAVVSPTRWSKTNPRRGATDYFTSNYVNGQYWFMDLHKITDDNKMLMWATAMVPTVDFNGDRKADFLVRMNGQFHLYWSKGNGRFTKGPQVGRNWAGMDQITFAGALNGDSTQFVIARQTNTGNLFAYRMAGNGALTYAGQIGRGWSQFSFIMSPGQMMGDSKHDLMAIDKKGGLWCFQARGGGHITNMGQCGRGWTNFSHVFFPGDMDGDGRYDLVGVKKLTKPDAYGNPTGGAGAAKEDKAPLYVYKNNGGGTWGQAKMIGYDFYQYDIIA